MLKQTSSTISYWEEQLKENPNALRLASGKHRPDRIEVILDLKNNKTTPIHAMVYLQQTDKLKEVLNVIDSDLENKKNENLTYLRAVLEKNHLLNSKEDREGKTPLIKLLTNTAKDDASEMVDLLLENGADVTIEDNDGYPALYYASTFTSGKGTSDAKIYNAIAKKTSGGIAAKIVSKLNEVIKQEKNAASLEHLKTIKNRIANTYRFNK